MFKTQRSAAFLSFVFLAGCASTGELTSTQVFDDGSRIECNVAGNPVRFTDTSGQLFASNPSQLVEQVFDDGTRIEYSAAGNPVRFTDTNGQQFASKPTRIFSSL